MNDLRIYGLTLEGWRPMMPGQNYRPPVVRLSDLETMDQAAYLIANLPKSDIVRPRLIKRLVICEGHAEKAYDPNPTMGFYKFFVPHNFGLRL